MTQSAIESDELRRRAELKVARRGLPSTVELDATRLLHELQVHKIELELQNEELIAAGREVELLRRRYEALYRLAPVGYLSLSRSGEVLEANDRAFAMLKRDLTSLLTHRLRNFLAPDSLAAFDAMIDAAGTTGKDSSADNLLVHRPHTVPIYVKAQCRLVEVDDQQSAVILLALMDVSALKFAMDDVVSSILR